MNQPNKYGRKESRRNFLKNLSLGVGASTVLATQSKLQLIQSAVAQSSSYTGLNDHKSLVCVFLNGGNDAFNMFVPYEENAYNAYKKSRSKMALSRESLLPLSGNNQAFHASMPDLQSLYNTKKLGVVANVGALIKPTTRTAYQNETAHLPADLFSHSHQQEFWQTGTTAKSSVHPPGWGGRMMDMLSAANTHPNNPSLFSLANNSVWSHGLKPLDFVLNQYSGVDEIHAFKSDDWPRWQNSRIDAWQKILKISHPSLLNQEMAKAYVNADERIGVLVEKLAQAQEITTVYPKENNLADGLKIVSKMISIREKLGMKRQIFFLTMGGWDSHGNQLNDHSVQLKKLNDALVSFYKTTEELGVADSVTTFTASEFGRSYSTNGDGTDHGWAGHNLVMGGAVKGGEIYGDLPDFELNGKDDAEDTGRFIPKYGVDQYGATLAQWMGMSAGDVDEIFPNLKNFDAKELGFLI